MTHMSNLDTFYREALQNIESAGRHRREFDWQDNGSGGYNLETPGGDFRAYQPNPRKPHQWNLDMPSGEQRTMYDSADEARDYAERSMSPDGYWPKHLRED